MALLHFTQVFCQGAPTHLIQRARGGLRDISDRAQRMKTKGFLMSSTTESALASVYKRSFIDGI